MIENLEFIGIIIAIFIGFVVFLKFKSDSDAKERFGDNPSRTIAEEAGKEGSSDGGGDGGGGDGGQ